MAGQVSTDDVEMNEAQLFDIQFILEQDKFNYRLYVCPNITLFSGKE